MMLVLVAATESYAQKGIFMNWQPELSATWKLGSRWQMNVKAVSFHTFLEPDVEGTTGNYRLNQAELSTFGTYRLSNTVSLSLGYMARWLDPIDEGGMENRLTEQLGFITQVGSKRIGNRIRVEQRWRPVGLVNRVRYRASMDLPLAGEVIDPGEMYLILSDELLWSFGRPVNAFGENRLNGGLGWYFSRKAKLEVHVQYRTRRILENTPTHAMVALSTFYLNF